jgi:phage repressor protein C with HTH and peptisase S24 domain
MSWATAYIEKLLKGETVSFRPRGNSMKPRINSGDLVTVSPEIGKLEEGDAVLCKVKGSHYVHLIKAIQDDRYQIGNNRGGINGWIGRNGIYGKVIAVEA